MKRSLFILSVVLLSVLAACSDSALDGWDPVDPVTNPSSTSSSISVDNGTIDATSASTASVVHITCDGQWTASSDVDWITLSLTSGTGDTDITLSISENLTTDVRSGAVTLRTGTNIASVRVMQTGKYLTVSPESLSFEAAGGTSSITVSTDGTFSASASDSWLTVTTSDNTISVTATSNNLATSRSGKVTVSLTGLTLGSLSREISVTQKASDYPVAEAIDLSLPSGTKWASWNIGASKPEEYGGYYAWGETEVQANNEYSLRSYSHYEGTAGTCHHIGDDIAGTEYDVAHVKWGGAWRMPTLNQMQELIDNCTRTWTSLNGVNGIKIMGPNGNTIFLPAAGNRSFGELHNEGTYGFFWSSSLDAGDERSARYLVFNSGGRHWYGGSRSVGMSVRAVCP